MSNAIDHVHRAAVILLLLAIGSVSLAGGSALGYDLLHAGSSAAGAGTGILSRAVDSAAGRVHIVLSLHALPLLGALGAVTVGTLCLLWLELRGAVSQPQLILSRGHLGQIAISLKHVGVLAQREAEHVAGVREVRTATHAGKAGIEVQQTISVEPQHQLPALAEQIQHRIKQSLEYHLGFPVKTVRVQLQQASLSKALL